METRTAAAERIRAAFKANGWSQRKVSVRVDSYSMGCTIRVLVKDVSVPLSMVKAIAETASVVRYCDASGEILSGGNRFVDVAYTREALAPLVAQIDAKLATVEADPGANVDIVPGVRAWAADRERGFWHAQGDLLTRDVYCCGREFCARQIAEQIAEWHARLPMPSELSDRECAETLPVPGLAPVVRLQAVRS